MESKFDKFRVVLTFCYWAIPFLFLFIFSNGKAQILKLPNGYKFLALGDSYTIGQSVSINQRWPQQLVDSLNSGGISCSELRYIAQTGWKTTELIQNIQNENPNNDFDLVSLCIGVNNQFQRTAISDYKKDLIFLLSTAREKANQSYANVLVLSIPDYAYTPFGQSSLASAQISSDINDFNLVKNKVCDSLSVRYINITNISRLGLVNPLLVANDGLHPSALQYSLWVNAIFNSITGLEKNWTHTKKPLFYPNPVSNKINFSLEVSSWRIIDLFSHETHNSTMGTNLNNLSPGVYILEMELENEAIERRKISIN